MADRNDPPHNTHRIIRSPANQDAASLLSNFQREREQTPFFTRRAIVPVVKPALAAELAPVKAEPALVAHSCTAVFSPAGGAGKSTITAALGSILCQQGKRVLLFDASPWQSVAFLFGAREAKVERRTFFAPGSKEISVTVLPSAEGDTSFAVLDELIASNKFDNVILDLSGVSGERLIALLRKCNSLIVPLLLNSSALRIAAAVNTLLKPLAGAMPRTRFVLNCTDDSALSKELREQLVAGLGDQLFPSSILFQPEVRRAQAEGIVLPSFAPEAQATLVLEELAQWLVTAGDATAATARRWSEG